MTDPFIGLIGQESLKRKLGFYLDAFAATKVMPFILFAGPKGTGKTLFARRLGKALTGSDGGKRPFVEINCATIKNARQFFEQIFVPLISNNEITLLFDEAHKLPSDLTQIFLSALNTEKETSREVRVGESAFVFDFTKLTVMFATTETDQIFPPLKDRLTLVDFAAYSEEEMGKIVQMNAPDIQFSVLPEVVSVVRGNARISVQMAKDVVRYCAVAGSKEFGAKEWKDLRHKLGIKHLGLTNMEENILVALKARGHLSLQMLASITGMSPNSLRRDVETFLLKLGLIDIEGHRKITPRGLTVVEKIVAEKG